MKVGVVSGLAAVAAVTMSGCGAQSVPSAAPSTTVSVSAGIHTTPGALATARALAGMPHADAAGYAVIGHGQAAVVTGGAVRTGAAWSTIKVPLAVAALPQGGTAADAASAIEASQNPPAERLWAVLGTPTNAAAAVGAELAAGGDVVTKVEIKQTYPPYSSFGQTVWPVADQARYASTLPCRAVAATVSSDMGHIAAADRIGFGAITVAGTVRYKIGWGPAKAPEHGSYARELATITLTDGRVYGVALIAHEPTMSAAQRDVTDLAVWLNPQLAGIAASPC